MSDQSAFPMSLVPLLFLPYNPLTAQKIFRSPCALSTPKTGRTSQLRMRQVIHPRASCRVACKLQYNGAAFHGWERKPNLRTVQQELEHAISAICKQPMCVQAASKTDAGTHAVGQVVHFDPPIHRQNARSWINSINRRLPSDVLVTDAAHVQTSFDARRSASWRRYRYTIFTDAQPSVFLDPFTWHYYQKPLDVAKMNAAALALKSDMPRNFSAFRKCGSAASHTQISVQAIAVRRNPSDERFVQLEVCANWFVYGMMRLLAASLLQVGSGALTVHQFISIANSGCRDSIKFSAPPNGLCLVEVGYPNKINPFNTQARRDAQFVDLDLPDSRFC